MYLFEQLLFISRSVQQVKYDTGSIRSTCRSAYLLTVGSTLLCLFMTLYPFPSSFSYVEALIHLYAHQACVHRLTLPSGFLILIQWKVLELKAITLGDRSRSRQKYKCGYSHPGESNNPKMLNPSFLDSYKKFIEIWTSVKTTQHN